MVTFLKSVELFYQLWQWVLLVPAQNKNKAKLGILNWQKDR